MNKKNDQKGLAGSEQNSHRATSGGGLGQGRETAAGMPKDKERSDKEMGGDQGTSGHVRKDPDPGSKGPASSTTTSDVRPSNAGKLGREGGIGINISDHDTDDLNSPAAGSEWTRQKGMGPESMDKDLKEKVSPTNVVDKHNSEDQ